MSGDFQQPPTMIVSKGICKRKTNFIWKGNWSRDSIQIWAMNGCECVGVEMCHKLAIFSSRQWFCWWWWYKNRRIEDIQVIRMTPVIIIECMPSFLDEMEKGYLPIYTLVHTCFQHAMIYECWAHTLWQPRYVEPEMRNSFDHSFIS